MIHEGECDVIELSVISRKCIDVTDVASKSRRRAEGVARQNLGFFFCKVDQYVFLPAAFSIEGAERKTGS